MPVITALYHYPVKGLSPRPAPRIHVAMGKPFPFDRVLGLARPDVPVMAEVPKWTKQGLFVMLMIDEGLASVRTSLDEKTLTMHDGERMVLSANLDDADERRAVEAFFHRLAPCCEASLSWSGRATGTSSTSPTGRDFTGHEDGVAVDSS